jgi:lipopolysaccharide/colanic/teichoic acid biosynthesis glycosyltransferase
MPASVPLRSRAQDSQSRALAQFAGQKRAQLLLKRGMDITASALLLLLTAPVMLICGLLIRLQDGGPAIHRRRVIGKDG